MGVRRLGLSIMGVALAACLFGGGAAEAHWIGSLAKALAHSGEEAAAVRAAGRAAQEGLAAEHVAADGAAAEHAAMDAKATEQAALAARAAHQMESPAWYGQLVTPDGQRMARVVPLHVNDDGEILAGFDNRPITNPHQLSAMLSSAGKESHAVVSEDDAFKHGPALAKLVGDDRLYVADDATGALREARYIHQGDVLKLRILTRAGLWIDADSRDSLKASEAVLEIKTSAHNVDLVSFFDPLDVRVRQGFDLAAGASHRAKSGQQAEDLVAEVRRGRQRVIVMVSHVENDLAVVRDPAGRITGSVPLAELQAAAERSDNTLIFLGCKTSQTPVGGFVGPVRTDPLVQTIAKAWHGGEFTFGDFLADLGQQGDGFVVSERQANSLHRAFDINPVSAASPTTAILLTGVTLTTLSPDRRSELGSRLIPFVPSYIPYFSIFGLVMVLAGPRMAWRSWASVLGRGFGPMAGGGLPLVGSLLLFLLLGSLAIAILRVSSKTYKALWLTPFFAAFLACASSVWLGLGLLVGCGLTAWLYGLAAKNIPRPPQKGFAKLAASFSFLTLCFVFQSLLAIFILLPFMVAEVDLGGWIGLVWLLAWMGGSAIGFILVRRTGEPPLEIFQRLWADPFWPLRQFVRMPLVAVA